MNNNKLVFVFLPLVVATSVFGASGSSRIKGSAFSLLGTEKQYKELRAALSQNPADAKKKRIDLTDEFFAAVRNMQIGDVDQDSGADSEVTTREKRKHQDRLSSRKRPKTQSTTV